MKITFLIKRTSFVFLFSSMMVMNLWGQTGKIAQKVAQLQKDGSFNRTSYWLISPSVNKQPNLEVDKMLSNYVLADEISTADILQSKPSLLTITVPVPGHRRQITLLLYQQDISPNGFRLIASDGKSYLLPNVLHFRGMVQNEPNSVAAISISENEISGIISVNETSFVIGKLQNERNQHIIYNERDLREKPLIDCGTDTKIPLEPATYIKGMKDANSTAGLTSKCVNWYWETDVDIFNTRGSVANVNTFIQGIFNQVATLYANDGISITLKTLFVWTTTDPYTGPSTSNYLDQFGVNRTSFDGDLATLIGYQGGGGIAWINGLCNSQTRYRMAYAGISNGYNTVPTYSWTVSVISHEQGHSLGSRHTHDCVWNGNNTKIDGCGDSAGYPSGSCPVPSPALPSGGGTIMSYCHLTSAGINFSNGFGPQPTALMIDRINNAACLSNCVGGCSNPSQPGAISGNNNPCTGTSVTYSIAAVSGATGYAWTLPSGWTGSSTTNSISVTAGTTSGNISVTATNSCGNSPASNLPVSAAIVPARPGIITGNISVCTGVSQTYSVSAVAGATSYTWVLPAGWTGTSTTNTITVVPGNTGGIMSIRAINACGNSQERTKAVSITTVVPAQPGIISGNTTVCQGSAQNYSIASVPNSSSYVWTFPSAWSAPTVSNVVNVTAGLYSGTISVAAVNGCGTGPKRNFTVSVNPLPVRPGVISITGGTAAVCPGETRSYAIPAVNGATSYTWVAPTGGTITSGQGSTSIQVSYNSNFVANGTVSVKANNACGSGIARTLTIPRNTPGAPASISGATSVCANATVTYSCPAVAGATSYTWTLPAGATIIGSATGNTVSIRWGSQGGSLAVKANNTCGSSGSRTVKVTINCAAGLAAGNSDNNLNVRIFPNPATTTTTVQFKSAVYTIGKLTIADMAGKKIREARMNINKGENRHILDISYLSKGTYLITIRAGENAHVIKLMVQ